jgi:signal transduction histidine kinase/CheY-like chemotaxis protein/HPt (histidine-containing phosphotransfer) domain-containing protein
MGTPSDLNAAPRQPMTAEKKTRSLRGKLQAIVVAVLCLVGFTTLGGVAWVNARTERQRLADIEAQVRSSIADKARVTAESHALALRGLVAENAFTDVQKLVQQAVDGDPEIIYGVFVSTEGAPWAYASPSTRQMDPEDTRAILNRWQEISLPAGSWTHPQPTQREVSQFGQNVFEVSRPVTDGNEVVGMIRYGFSTAALQTALAQVREESRQTLRNTLIWIALDVLLVTLAGSFFVSRAASRIVRPLQSLTEASRRIASGETGVRVEVDTTDELQVLAQSFNQMQVANEEAMRRLSEAMAAALEASRLKSEFVANMSHEIRTPMNGITGMIRLILRMPLESKLRRYAETIDASAAALLTIINDVLDFSKMEAGKYTIQSVPFDPTSVVQDVAELNSGRAHDKALELVYRCDPDIPHAVTGDPDRYRQILNNLIGNAIKFSDEGEIFVDVSVDSRGADGIVIRTIVQDNGVGISEADQQRLFEAFSQVDGSLVRRHGGTGLGLVISKRLVEMMGGQIGVKSERGVGSTFWFTIRVTASDAPARPSLVAFPAGHRALVVEASRRWCRIIEEHMTAWGLSCSVHHDGFPALEALEKAKPERPFDLVVVGARLRDITIESFVKQLREIPAGRKLPLIVLTQLGETATLSEVEKEVAAQVAKPLRLSELYECIMDAFSGGRREQRLTPRPQSRRRSRARGRILIVDDNETNQFVALELVEAAGYDADVAVDGKEAVRMAQERRYAAILMDCQMPVMDGYTATREIRAWEGDRHHTPIIALTAHAMAGERDKVIGAGMDDYLSKPLKPHSLEKMLERYATGGDSGPPTAPPPPIVVADDESEPSRAPLELDPTLERSARLSSLFLARTPEILVELEAAVKNRDAQRIRDRAHKLKGSCLAVGAEVLAQMSQAMQFAAEQGTVEGMHERTQEIRAQFDRVSTLLHQELNANGAERSERTSGAPN